MRAILYLVFVLRFCHADNNMSYPIKLKNVVESDCNCSVYSRSFQKILNRNKRWFVFPKGANVLMTMVVTKTIIDGRPRGLQESLEMEMAVSLPPWVEGWRPITLLENVDKEKSAAPKRTAPKTEHSTAVAQPKIDKISDLGQIRHWQIHEKNNLITKKPTRIYGLEVSIKSCIMRAICEVKHGLLPEGESFIHDVARILFTIPLDHKIEDDYVNVARDEDTNCAKKFYITCPFNPIELFLQSGLRPPIR